MIALRNRCKALPRIPHPASSGVMRCSRRRMSAGIGARNSTSSYVPHQLIGAGTLPITEVDRVIQKDSSLPNPFHGSAPLSIGSYWFAFKGIPLSAWAEPKVTGKNPDKSWSPRKFKDTKYMSLYREPCGMRTTYWSFNASAGC